VVARAPSPDADGEEHGGLTPPLSDRPQRGNSKRNYAELAGKNDEDDEEDGLDKKVKIEVGEDIGEGLRQTNDDEEEAALDGAGFFSQRMQH